LVDDEIPEEDEFHNYCSLLGASGAWVLPKVGVD